MSKKEALDLDPTLLLPHIIVSDLLLGEAVWA